MEPNNPIGTIPYYASIENPPSPSLRKKRVFLSLISEKDDEILEKEGLASLRQARILRLSREALEQGALLAYNDLTNLLLTSLSTVKRDLRVLRKEGFPVPIYRKRQRARSMKED
ncbi:MAG: DUF1670 domain-containing protein [Candidatus Binatia bacterium]